jgi:Preprotein translocase subunit SecY
MSNFSDISTSGSGSQSSDLTKRILYTLFILIIYRFCTYVPLPGIDPDSLKNLITGNERSLLVCLICLPEELCNEWQF